MINRYFWIAVATLFVFPACKISGVNGGENKFKNQALAASRDYYLWYNQIPENFNMSGYDDPADVLEGIRSFSIEPGFPEPVDHYSFAIKKAEWEKISTGQAKDYGLNAFFMNENDLRVRAVEPASPAGLAGIRRGWRITKIAGSNNINSSNINFIGNQLYNSNTVSITFELPNGDTRDINLTTAEYQETPLYLDTVYTEGSKKVGYLVMNSFLGDVEDITAAFAPIFSGFVSENVTDIIVDVRYNGGGYVSLQETLCNYLVKSSATGSIMMTEQFNDKHQNKNVTLKFEKLGTLNINNIYFIVSENTASASELLINNLKPYMNVKLVGEKTYGKPVGFFGIPVGDWLVFPVSFRSVNGVGEGNYFDGITVDKESVDGLNKDWGDKDESVLAATLTHIRTGAFSYVPSLNSTLQTNIKSANSRLNKNFKGAIN